MKPVLCLITDRHRLAGDDLMPRIAAAARAGVHLVQVRERDLDGGPLADVVARTVGAVRGTGARVLVNDRLDVALAAGAHGVHLRADSVPASRVRSVVPPGFLIGRSVHTLADVARATDDGGADYLIFGTVFATASKQGREAAGPDLLARAAASTPLPVLAVGGISIDTAALVARAGAAGVAAIGLFAAPAIEQLPVVVASLAANFDDGRRRGGLSR